MTIVVLPLLGLLVAFVLGVLTGTGQVTRAQDTRDRRQAAVQRDLNLQFRILREQQETAEKGMCWASKQQAGLVVIDYDSSTPFTPSESPRRRPIPQRSR